MIWEREMNIKEKKIIKVCVVCQSVITLIILLLGLNSIHIPSFLISLFGVYMIIAFFMIAFILRKR